MKLSKGKIKKIFKKKNTSNKNNKKKRKARRKYYVTRKNKRFVNLRQKTLKNKRGIVGGDRQQAQETIDDNNPKYGFLSDGVLQTYSIGTRPYGKPGLISKQIQGKEYIKNIEDKQLSDDKKKKGTSSKFY